MAVGSQRDIPKLKVDLDLIDGTRLPYIYVLICLFDDYEGRCPGLTAKFSSLVTWDYRTSSDWMIYACKPNFTSLVWFNGFM